MYCKKLAIVIIIYCTVLLCGCVEQDKPVQGNPEVGIIYTTHDNAGSMIEWFDAESNSIGRRKYSFSSTYFDGFMNTAIVDNRLFLFPRGNYYEKDYGKLTMIDVNNGDCQEISVGRYNVTGYCVKGDTVAFSSNSNNECYVETLDIKTDERDSIVVEGTTVFDVAFVGDGVYGVSMDDESNVCLVSFDFERNEYETIMHLPDDDTPAFLQNSGDVLMFISDDKLVKYSTDSHKAEVTELTRPGAYNINLSRDMLWIAYTDIMDDEAESLIEARKIDSGEIVISETVPNPILQMEVRDNRLCIASYEDVVIYEISDNELKTTQRIIPENSSYDFGGVFLINEEEEL